MTSSSTTKDNEIPNSSTRLGTWEAHTRGIGSRILSNMGYPGYGGLGLSGQGMEHSVASSLEKYQIHTMKWNKRPSLDVIMMKRDKISKTNSPSIVKSFRKKKNAKNRHSSESKTNLPNKDVFDFINSTLKHTPNDESDFFHTKKASVDINKLKIVNKSSLFEVQEQINRMKLKIEQNQQTIERNQGKDRLVCQMAQQKLTLYQDELAKLKKTRRQVEQTLRQKTNEKKSKIF